MPQTSKTQKPRNQSKMPRAYWVNGLKADPHQSNCSSRKWSQVTIQAQAYTLCSTCDLRFEFKCHLDVLLLILSTCGEQMLVIFLDKKKWKTSEISSNQHQVWRLLSPPKKRIWLIYYFKSCLTITFSLLGYSEWPKGCPSDRCELWLGPQLCGGQQWASLRVWNSGQWTTGSWTWCQGM